jgi:hypothetical protein
MTSNGCQGGIPSRCAVGCNASPLCPLRVKKRNPRYVRFGPQQQMRWMAPAHGIWVPKCEGPKAFTSKIGAIRYADYHDRPRLGQERFSGPRH